MADILAIADRRSRALVNRFLRDPRGVLVACESLDMVRLTARYTGNATPRIVELPGFRESSAVMVEAGSDRDLMWSVWARPKYADYKAAYIAFLEAAYGKPVASGTWPAHLQVDHVSNKAFADEEEYIRLEAIPKDPNKKWGENFEARRTANTHNRGNHDMSFMSCAKLAGLVAPVGGLRDTAAVNNLVAWFTMRGIPQDEARDGVENMLRHAYWVRND